MANSVVITIDMFHIVTCNVVISGVINKAQFLNVNKTRLWLSAAFPPFFISPPSRTGNISTRRVIVEIR